MTYIRAAAVGCLGVGLAQLFGWIPIQGLAPLLYLATGIGLSVSLVAVERRLSEVARARDVQSDAGSRESAL